MNNLNGSGRANSDPNLSFANPARGDLEGAISKLSELIEKDFELTVSSLDQDIYEDCMRDREMIHDRFGVERMPLGEIQQNTVDNTHTESEVKYDRTMMSPEQKLKSSCMKLSFIV
jgi:hypothetical protein